VSSFSRHATTTEGVSRHLPLATWLMAIDLITQSKTNMAALELRRHLGVSYRTAWLLKHKIMEAMRQRENTRPLSGDVRTEGAYLGGERSGGHRRSGLAEQGRLRGGGGDGR